MSSEWVVIGTDNFSHEDYPLSIHTDRNKALAEAQRRDDDMKRQHPELGYIRDTYRVFSLPEACRVTGLNEEGVRALVNVLGR